MSFFNLINFIGHLIALTSFSQLYLSLEEISLCHVHQLYSPQIPYLSEAAWKVSINFFPNLTIFLSISNSEITQLPRVTIVMAILRLKISGPLFATTNLIFNIFVFAD